MCKTCTCWKHFLDPRIQSVFYETLKAPHLRGLHQPNRPQQLVDLTLVWYSPPCSWVSAIICVSAGSSFSTLCGLEIYFCCPITREFWLWRLLSGDKSQQGTLPKSLVFPATGNTLNSLVHSVFKQPLGMGSLASFLGWVKWGSVICPRSRSK